MYQSIVNRQGIYRTGDHYHKLIGDYIVSVHKEDYRNLSSIKVVDEMTLRANGVKVFNYTTGDVSNSASGRTKASCDYVNGSTRQAEYFYNPANCQNDRKAFISSRDFWSVFTGYGDFNGTSRYGDFYQKAVEFRVWAQRRYAITCNFNNYDNPLEWRSITFTRWGAQVYGYASDWSLFWWQVYTVNVPNWSSGGANVMSYADVVPYGDVVFNTTSTTSHPNQPNLYGVHEYLYAEGTSQGIGNNWAVLLCWNWH